jgi:PAS domain S-box-containing protein
MVDTPPARREAARVAQDVLQLDVRGHAVQFYDREEALHDVVVRYLHEGISRGDSCLVIATEAHGRAFRDGLAAHGVDARALVECGRLVLLDAGDTLKTFLDAGVPDATRFERTIGATLDEVRANAPSGAVRAYGEMVDVLWADGNATGAIELERLWNELAATRSFALLCAYAMSRFGTAAEAAGLASVCAQHTHVVATEAYDGVDDDDLRRRQVVALQQRALALETEVARREAAEHLAKTREEDLTDFLENAAVAIHWVGPDGRILWANRAELELLGYSREEYVGRNIRDFHVDAAGIEAILERLDRGETLRGHESRVRRKDGAIRDVIIDSNVRWRDGEFIHTRCFTRDISEEKRAHDALRHLHQVTQMLSAVSTVDEVLDVLVGEGVEATGACGGAVFLVDRETQTLELLRARGYPERVVERHARLPLATRTPITDCVRDERPIFIESGTGPYDGENADIFAIGSEARVAVPMVASSRVIGGLKLSFDEQHTFDAHERVFLDALAKQGAQALERARLFESERQARRDAETSDRRKDEFLAMLGHELRNPLAPIRTALELMRLRGHAATREQQVIERQVEHLGRLVDDLLDVSRITRGKVKLDQQSLEVSSVLAKAIEIATPLLEQQAHELTTDVARGLRVLGDPIRLAQVVSNLLTNAAKYTPPSGHIHVSAARDHDHVVVRIRDNGNGIAPELLPRIFELFVQGDRDRDRQQGGLGIGLALAKNLTELHGGTISATSAGLGAGSEFAIRLPMLHEARTAERTPRTEPAKPATDPLRILVVDDNVDAAELIAEVLASSGHEVALVHDGPSAIARAVEFRPDAALVDIGLPVMDGFEVAGRLRELMPGPLRLVAVTGYGQPSDKAKTRAAGFDDHLVKPVGLEALMSSLAIAPRRRNRDD